MPFTKTAVEHLISEKAAAITKCGASNNIRVPDLDSWLSHFGLKIIFHDYPPAEIRPIAFSFIRRIYAAFLEYDLAQQGVQKHIKDGGGRWSPYFAALTHFEIAISQIYIALDSIRKHSGQEIFKSGDGSFEQRLNSIYNAGKHQIAKTELPVWFTNEGIACSAAEISFVEIENKLLEMAEVVKGISEPPEDDSK